ncbi:MAG: arsenate reductase ArsC [Anaerolineaceae bacterium]|nr:arsenate reductase ArsC [Anaerolineaceae bacterium]
MKDHKLQVLILCTANSARSQMGEGLLRHLAGDRVDVYSAGSEPSVVNPFAIRAMLDLGIDISSHRSKSLNEFLDQQFDYVITVCDNAAKNCPMFPGKAVRIHWGLTDPAAVEGSEEEKLNSFRKVRDELKKYLVEWLLTV